MYNSKEDMLEDKLERLKKKLDEENQWANEGLNGENLTPEAISFFKGVKYLAATLAEQM